MKRTGILLLLLCSCSYSTPWAQAQTLAWPTKIDRRIAHLSRTRGLPESYRQLRRVVPARLPASATKAVTQVQCPPEAEGAACGYVQVPLDRKHPDRGTIDIYFELYPHTGSGPAESAILANFGGAGDTTVGWRWYAFYLFGQNLDVHDLLLIDDRGTGLSGAIDCPALQHGTAPFDQAVADCAAQLGLAASRYGTGEVAQDTEDVRAALGYEKVDYFGNSYGGLDVTAYVTRFGERLRSIVLDSPVGKPSLNPFAHERYGTDGVAPVVRLACSYSPTCSPDHPDPLAELNALIWAVRLHPVKGDAYDFNGNLLHISIDEEALLNYVLFGGWPNTLGEILAAARSLWQGDSQPLLRLGAELYYPLEYDHGDPAITSMGANMARSSMDFDVPWSWSVPVRKRQVQFGKAVSALPWDYFAPFSKSVATGLLFSGTRESLYWEKPTPSSPVEPSQPTHPRVPTLVLGGDLDMWVPMKESQAVAQLFLDSEYVSVAGSEHCTNCWTQCGARLASDFIQMLQVGDTSCAHKPEIVWPAVGRFPLLAKDARSATVDPEGQNEISLAERKVVTVAVATATDAIQRSILGLGDGVGLRSGTFHTEYGDTTWTTTLTDCAFAKDVIVSGTVTWDVEILLAWRGGPFVADLTVSGSGTAGGTLHVVGTWAAPGPVGNFKVSGTLGGKRVAVLVPEA